MTWVWVIRGQAEVVCPEVGSRDQSHALVDRSEALGNWAKGKLAG